MRGGTSYSVSRVLSSCHAALFRSFFAASFSYSHRVSRFVVVRLSHSSSLFPLFASFLSAIRPHLFRHGILRSRSKRSHLIVVYLLFQDRFPSYHDLSPSKNVLLHAIATFGHFATFSLFFYLPCLMFTFSGCVPAFRYLLFFLPSFPLFALYLLLFLSCFFREAFLRPARARCQALVSDLLGRLVGTISVWTCARGLVGRRTGRRPIWGRFFSW